MKKTIFLILLVLLIFSCTKEKSKYEVSFQSIFNDIKIRSIKRQELNWNEIEKKVRDSVKQFQSIEDFYFGIEYTLKLINDNHSFFLRPKNNFFLSETATIDVDTFRIPNVNSKMIKDNIGYLRISGYTAPNIELAKLYSIKIRKELMKLDSFPNLKGWIIDLSNNVGGHSFSQPLALSPLLNDSILGYSENYKGEFKKIVCSNNIYYKESEYGKPIIIDYNYNLNHKNKKIAVLISEKTASSGEFVSLVLKSQENSRLFGMETKGLTSTLNPANFQDGAILFLAQDFWYDRKKNKVNGGIKPHVECSKEKSLELAIEWIENDI